MVMDSDEEELSLGALMEDAYLDEDDEEQEEDEPTLTFKIEHGRIRSKTDELDAMIQAVDKILKTERYVYPIYDEQYGNDLPELIGESFSYAQTEVKRMLTEALEADDRVTSVEIMSIERTSNNSLNVQGKCLTVYGAITIDEEVSLVES